MKKNVIVIALLALAIIGYVIFNIQQPRYHEVNIAPRANISVFQTSPGSRGQSPISMIDNDIDTWWYGYVDSERPNWIELRWDEPKQIDKIVVNFGGNRQPANYKLQIWDGESWSDRFTIVENQTDVVKHIFEPEKVLSSKIRLYVTQVLIGDNLMRVTEFYVYKKRLAPFHRLPDYLVFLVIFFLLGYVFKKMTWRKRFIVGISFLVALGYIAFKISLPQYAYTNLAPEANISVFQTSPGLRGQSPISMIDSDINTWWYGYVDEEHPNWIELRWDEPKQIDKIVVNFGGYRAAVDYRLRVWNGESWTYRFIVENNGADWIEHHFAGDKTLVSKIRLFITKTAADDHIQRCSEFYVYQKHPVFTWEAFLTYSTFPLKRLFVYAGYSFVFLIILFLPGYVLLNLFTRSLDYEEKFALSFAITIFLFFAFTTLSLAIGNLRLLYLIPVLLIFAIAIFIKKKMYLDLQKVERVLPLFLLLALSLLIFYEFLMDSRINHCWYQCDYQIFLGEARTFLYQWDVKSEKAINAMWGYWVSDRTPLFGILPVLFLYFWGDQFIIYQMLSNVVVSIFLLTAFLLFRKLFSKEVAIFSLPFLVISHYALWMNTMSQPRYFVTYFLFAYFYFLVSTQKKRHLLSAGFMAGLAYLVHPLSLPYILSGFAYIAFRRWRDGFKPIIKNFGKILLPLGIFVIPWLIWCRNYGRPNPMFLAPFITDHSLIFSDLDKQLIIRIFLQIPKIINIIQNKVYNFIGLFLFDPKKNLANFGLDMYQGTLLNAVMWPLSLFSIYGFIKYFKEYKSEILCFIILNIFMVLAFIGPYAAFLIQHLVPIVPVIAAIGIYSLLRLKDKTLIFVVYNLCLAEHIYIVWALNSMGRGIVIELFKTNLIILAGLVWWYVYNEILVYKSKLGD